MATMMGYPGAQAALPPGLRPVGFGARLLARLLDGLFALIAYAGLGWLVWSIVDRAVIDTLAIIGGIVFVAWVVLSLWAILGRGARLAGVLLGQRWVTMAGLRPGLALVGKFLAQAGLAAVSAGIAEAIISLVSGKPPLRRTWFDRIAGLVLVTGRATGEQPRPQAPAPVGQVRPVQLPDHRAPVGPGSGVVAPGAGVGAGFGAGVGPGAHPGPGGRPGQGGMPGQGGVPGQSGPNGPIQNVGVNAVNAGFIASLPFGSGGDRVAPPHAAPERPRPPMVIRDRNRPGSSPGVPAPRPQPPASTEHTMLAPHADAPSGATAWLRLDDGARIDLPTSVVFGRDPVPPPDLATARPYPLTDPSMQVSKTHAAVGADPGGVWVVDLYSTNGVRAAPPGAAAEPIACAQPVVVPVGGRIEIGGRSLEVCRD